MPENSLNARSRANKILRPTKEAVVVRGKLFYSEGDRAWTNLRLKKEILQEYPYLKERRSSFVYFMKMHRSHEELKKELAELEKQGAIPIIFFLARDDKKTEENTKQPSLQ